MARRVVAGSYSLTGSLAAKQGLQLDPQSLNLTADTSRTTIPAKALWASAHLNDKLTVQNALFPEGILYRTDTLNHPMTRCKLWYSGYFLQTRGIQTLADFEPDCPASWLYKRSTIATPFADQGLWGSELNPNFTSPDSAEA